jgi:hypothetical protein
MAVFDHINLKIQDVKLVAQSPNNMIVYVPAIAHHMAVNS